MKRLPIKDYETLYEISNTGKVFSLERIVKGKDGAMYPFKAKELKLSLNCQTGYYQVSLWKNGVGTTKYVHRLVAETFISNPLSLLEVNHKDGNRMNNHVFNLEWVSRLGNITHAIQTGLRVYTNRLTENEFIECLQSVIEGESYLHLSNRVPYKVPFLSVKLRKIAKQNEIEHLLDESLYQQKVKRARINGNKNK